MASAMPPLPPVPVTITNMDGGAPFQAKLNPTSISLSRKVKWNSTSAVQQTYSVLEFTGCDVDDFEFELLLDASEGTGTVLTSVQSIYAWTVPLTTLKTPRPPLLLFTWGTFTFEGVVESIDIEFVLFDTAGVPRRAEVEIKMTGQAFQKGIPPTTFFKEVINPNSGNMG